MAKRINVKHLLKEEKFFKILTNSIEQDVTLIIDEDKRVLIKYRGRISFGGHKRYATKPGGRPPTGEIRRGATKPGGRPGGKGGTKKSGRRPFKK